MGVKGQIHTHHRNKQVSHIGKLSELSGRKLAPFQILFGGFGIEEKQCPKMLSDYRDAQSITRLELPTR